MSEDIVENFIQKYKKLVCSEPHLAVHNFRCQNSNYSDQLNDSKNAYICFNGYGIEDCYYLSDSRWDKNCADLTHSNKCELCYECIDCESCYNCDFCQDCEQCTDCRHCFDCFSCENCFGCIGLKKKKFYIFNNAFSKDDYTKELAKISKGKIKSKLANLRLDTPRLATRTRNIENCFGNYVYDSRNSEYVFKVHNLEDCFYITDSDSLKDCMDADMTFKSQLMYEAIEGTDNYNCNFLFWSANCVDCEYVMYGFNCENCFGCFNLRHKKFQILNQEYPPEKYFELTTKIKESLRGKRTYNNFLPDIVE